MIRIWSKPDTQGFIKRLREAGYTVTKDASGRYESSHEGVQIFSALPGARGYLISLSDKIVQEVA